MPDLIKRRTVDLLVEQFWKRGYLTVSRRFGTYLPEPAKVGGFDVDIVAKQRNSYAIGITLTEDDFKNSDLPERIIFLATRQTKFTNRKVMLFIGVPVEFFKNAKVLLEQIPADVRKNIRLFEIADRISPERRRSRERGNVLFS